MIEVGEFVRTRDGQIVKLENNEEFYEDSVDVGIGIMPAVDGIWIDKEYLDYIEKEDIVKHSKQIKDLIKEGDYVNGYYCRYITDINTGEKHLCNYDFNEMQWIPLENIDVWDNILTKELFEANCYKVKEEIC